MLFTVVWNIIQETMPTFEKLKYQPNSQNESIQIGLCFSHYKHHTDIQQPKLSTEI